MPSINALTGRVRLLKSDERLLQQSVALVDCFVQNFEEIFGADDAILSEALEQVREPLGLIEKAVEARFKKAEAKLADADQPKPKIAESA